MTQKDFDEEAKTTVSKIEKEVSLWAKAARVAPLVGLAGILFGYYLDLGEVLGLVIFVGAVTFFTISVFWWWWAIFKIRDIARLMNGAADKFTDLKTELAKFKKDFKE